MINLNLKQITQEESCILGSATLMMLLSSICLCLNYFYFQYTGNNYCPPEMPEALLGMILLVTGLYLLYGKDHFSFKMARELLYFFMLLLILSIFAIAVQYTPFNPIDKNILQIENYFGIHLTDYMAWANQYPLFIKLLVYTYNSLCLQMAFLPLVMIVLRRTHVLRRFYFLLLNCVIIGFTFYYFFPTTAPASVLQSPFFMDIQRDTGLKFYQVHHALPLTTLEGGLIAFPSFHVIWAWLCVDLVKSVRWLYIPLVPVNIILVFSCVFLGWHYPVDVLGSLVVILLSCWSLRFFKSPIASSNSKTLPAFSATIK